MIEPKLIRPKFPGPCASHRVRIKSDGTRIRCFGNLSLPRMSALRTRTILISPVRSPPILPTYSLQVTFLSSSQTRLDSALPGAVSATRRLAPRLSTPVMSDSVSRSAFLDISPLSYFLQLRVVRLSTRNAWQLNTNLRTVRNLCVLFAV